MASNPSQYGAGGGFTNPMTTAGDIIDATTGGAAQRLAIGSANQVLTVSSGAPAWVNASTGFANPMTTLGDVIYENNTPAPARLAGNTTSTKKFLTQTGTGSVSANPGWNTIVAGDVPTLNQNTTGTASNITDTLDQVPAAAANVALGSNKITGLANGTAASDAAAFGQILPKAGGTMTGALAPAVVTLTFSSGGTTAIDADDGNAFALTLTDSTSTLGSPSNSVDGQVIRIRMIQDNTGSRTIAYNAVYDFGTAGSPTLTTGANKVDILGFEYVSSLTKWCYLGSGLGF